MTSRLVVIKSGFPGRILGFGGEGCDLAGPLHVGALNAKLAGGFVDAGFVPATT